MGQWNNYYGNCKWPDHAASYAWPGESESESESDGDGDIGSRGRGGRGGRGRKGGRGSRTKKSPGQLITRGGAVKKTTRGSGRRAIT